MGFVFCRWVFCSADGFSSSADGCCANAGISRAGVASKMKNPQQQQKRNSQQIQKNRGVSSRRGKQKRENSKEDRRGKRRRAVKQMATSSYLQTITITQGADHAQQTQNIKAAITKTPNKTKNPATVLRKKPTTTKNEQKRNSPTRFRMCKQEEEEEEKKDDDDKDSEENKRAFCDKYLNP